MFRSLIATLLVLGCSIVSHAADKPASEASIKEMLALSEARQLVDSMFGQIDGMMRATVQQSLGGKELTPEAQKSMEAMNSKVMAMMQEELSWEKLEPLYVEIYQKSFTQEEVDGLIAFYKSPAGVALIKKMPVVMQQSMAAMQQRMGPLMQRVQTIVKESAAEMRAQQKSKP